MLLELDAETTGVAVTPDSEDSTEKCSHKLRFAGGDGDGLTSAPNARTTRGTHGWSLAPVFMVFLASRACEIAAVHIPANAAARP